MRTRLTPIALLAPFVLAATVATSPTAAEEAYVGDEVTLTFRSGPGSQHQILQFVRTGDQLEILDPPEDAIDDFGEDVLEEWVFVRDDDGEEGWVQQRFLTEEPPARLRLPEVEAQLEAAREEIAALEETISEAEAERDELEDELAEAEEYIAELEADLEAAGDAHELIEDNEQLQERVARLLDRNEELEQQNRALAERSRQEWFLAGAGVLVGGLILGLILPRLRPRRSSWGSDL